MKKKSNMKNLNTMKYNQVFRELSEKIMTTLGPGGRYVAFTETAQITKDGATVARYLPSIAETNEEIFMSKMLEDLTRSANRYGDGTTSCVVLANKMLELGIKPELDKVVDKLVKHIRSQTNTSQELLEKVISTAGHEETTEYVLDAFRETDAVSVQLGYGTETTMEITSGIKIPTPLFGGFESVSNLTDVFIVLYEGDLHYFSDISKLVTEYGDAAKGRGLVILARSFSEEVHGYFQSLYSQSNGTLGILPIRSPWRGSKIRDYFMDIATLVGARVVEEGGLDTINFLDIAGSANVEADATNTLISNLKPTPEANLRIDSIKNLLKTAEGVMKEEYKERLNFFETSYAEINIGAGTISEAREMYTRTLDAVGSAKAFLKDGAVLGGGKVYQGIDLGEYQALTTAVEERIKINGGTLSDDVYDATEVVVNSLTTALSLAKVIDRIKFIL